MKKNIVILSRFNGNNTPFRSYVFSHAKALAANGNDVTAVVVTNFFPFLKKRVKRENCVIDGIKIIYCNTIGFSNLLYNSRINLNGLSCYFAAKRQIKKILKEKKIDLLDAHTFKNEGYAAALLKRKYGFKTYVTLHGSSFNKNLNTKNGIKQIKFVGSIIDKYICVSNKIYNQLSELKIENKKVIYNGIELYKVNRNNDNHNICTLGGLSKIKNIDIVIKAFSKVLKIYEDAKLYIIGDGVLKDELQRLVEKLEIKGNVFFKGLVPNEEVYNIFSSCNIFSLISKPEGFGIAYCEAMYSGCISIGTIGEGIDGFIKNNVNGFLIEVNEQELADKIIYIFDNNCDKIRKKGIETASELTWEKNALKYME